MPADRTSEPAFEAGGDAGAIARPLCSERWGRWLGRLPQRQCVLRTADQSPIPAPLLVDLPSGID